MGVGGKDEQREERDERGRKGEEKAGERKRGGERVVLEKCVDAPRNAARLLIRLRCQSACRGEVKESRLTTR